jgi:hypothetical protein
MFAFGFFLYSTLELDWYFRPDLACYSRKDTRQCGVRLQNTLQHTWSRIDLLEKKLACPKT